MPPVSANHFCSNAEGGVGLICACLPALNALFTNATSQTASKSLEPGGRLENELGNMRASTRGPSGAVTSKTSYADIGSDQVVLISKEKGASFETDSQGDSESGTQGIRKVVDISHSVDHVR